MKLKDFTFLCDFWKLSCHKSGIFKGIFPVIHTGYVGLYPEFFKVLVGLDPFGLFNIHSPVIGIPVPCNNNLLKGDLSLFVNLWNDLFQGPVGNEQKYCCKQDANR